MNRSIENDSALSAIADLTKRTEDLEEIVGYLNDRQKIVDIYRRYTRGLNRYDLELLKSAFWFDAEISYGENSFGRDVWVERWERDRYLKGLACQAHHIVNDTVDIAGDVAHVETYLISFWRPEQDEPAQIIGGRYVDRVDRRDGEWRIAVREFLPHFWAEAKSIFHSHLSPMTWSPAYLGANDRSDPSYNRPLTARSMRQTVPNTQRT